MMWKFAACLLVAALAGLTSLAYACDLQCTLQDSSESTSDSPCHSDGPHPAAPKHDVHAREVAKAPPVLPIPDSLIPVHLDELPLHEATSVFASVLGITPAGSLVLRI